MSPLRHAWYETFLHLHILLAIMAFVALWYHLQGLIQQRVLLGTIVLWGLEVQSFPPPPARIQTCQGLYTLTIHNSDLPDS